MTLRQRRAIAVGSFVIVIVAAGLLALLRRPDDVTTLALIVLVGVFGAAAGALWILVDIAEREDRTR